MMRLKEKLTKTETVLAEYKGRGLEKEPVYGYYMDLASFSGMTIVDRVRHVFGTEDGDIISLRPEDVPRNLEEGQSYKIKIRKFLGLETSKKVVS
jgi:hypothetical protein